MKITVTEHERTIITQALLEINTPIAAFLAAKISVQDPTDDGPEVGILKLKLLTL